MKTRKNFASRSLLGLFVILLGCEVSDISNTESRTEPAIGPLAGSAHTASAAAEYEIIDLGTLGGNRSVAWGINDAGQVVGDSRTISGEVHAFFWDEAGGMRDLGTLGGNRSVALGINEAGQVIGWSSNSSGESRAFLWDAAAGMQDLGTLGGNFSQAQDINNVGEVVGWSRNSNGENRAFLWDATNGMQDLGTLGGAFSRAWGINNQDQIVGESATGFGETHAFIWDESNGVRDLGTLGGTTAITFSEALAINDQGQTVGRSSKNSGETPAFLWEESVGMQEIGTLLDGFNSQARGINEMTQVVGFSTISAIFPNDVRAFVWDESDGMRDLGTLDNRSAIAEDINNLEQIAGSISLSLNELRAVLWQPVGTADTTPPEISYKINKTTLWPPNHKLKHVLSKISASDDSGEPVSITILVTSNESVNGQGDGNTAPDWEVVQAADGSYEVYVRAERSGRGNGRVYTITMSAEDAAGNSAKAIEQVRVEHDKGKKTKK